MTEVLPAERLASMCLKRDLATLSQSANRLRKRLTKDKILLEKMGLRSEEKGLRAEGKERNCEYDKSLRNFSLNDSGNMAIC